jgi:hypothetical protein
MKEEFQKEKTMDAISNVITRMLAQMAARNTRSPSDSERS